MFWLQYDNRFVEIGVNNKFYLIKMYMILKIVEDYIIIMCLYS